MQFQQCLQYSDLPKTEYPETDDERDALAAEFEDVFYRLSAALGEHYLVDDQGGGGVLNAVISMSKHVSVCQHHNIVVDSPAWDPAIIHTMLDLLAELPKGWTFGIDATDFPPGQAHIVVQQDGLVLGWSEYGARKTLTKFGFPREDGAQRNAWRFIVDCVDGFKTRRAVRATIRKNSSKVALEMQKNVDRIAKDLLDESSGEQDTDIRPPASRKSNAE